MGNRRSLTQIEYAAVIQSGDWILEKGSNAQVVQSTAYLVLHGQVGKLPDGSRISFIASMDDENCHRFAADNIQLEICGLRLNISEGTFDPEFISKRPAKISPKNEF